MNIKQAFFLFTIFKSGYCFAQMKVIDKSTILPREIDFKDCVKKITLRDYKFNKKIDKIDTVKTISEINFSPKNKIELLKNYGKSLNDLRQIVEFDVLERVKTISKQTNDKTIPFVNQFFSTSTEFPNSILLNNNENYKEKYINHFQHNLVIRQDHFVNDSLQDYRIYKYNSQNQLIEDLYINPENETDETVIYKSNSEMSFYPEKLTLYEYKKVKDTIIEIKIRPKFSLKYVTKKLKTNKYSLEIKEEYDKDILENLRFIYTYKDSISEINYYYNSNREIRDYYKSLTTPKSIITKWKTKGYSNNEEQSEIIKIDIVYDRFKNWVKKSYSNNNLITRILEREIEYYCH